MSWHFKAAVCVVAVAAVSACAIAFAAVIHPTLISPNGKVGPGHIKLVVKDLGAHGKVTVFVQIEPHKRFGKHGVLKSCIDSSHGCDFVQLKRVKGKPGYWSFVSQVYNFPGWWSTTPGRYYWQARHADCSIPGCADVSKVGSFVVK
jgi:hypothetical protein